MVGTKSLETACPVMSTTFVEENTSVVQARSLYRRKVMVPVGTSVRFRVSEPTGHPRQHGFTLHGHSWFHEPWVNNSTVQWRPGVDPEPNSMNLGTQGGHSARRHWNIILPNAGGGFGVTGDYLFRTQESFQFTNGLWGIFRVYKPVDKSCLSCLPPPQTGTISPEP